MHNSELTAVFALGAALAWGVSDFFAAKAAKNIGPVLTLVLITVLGAPLYIAFYLLTRQQWHMQAAGFTFAVSASLLLTTASGLFFKGLEKGPVSIVSPIASMYPLVTTLVALGVFGAHLTGTQSVGIILVVIGVAAASGLMTIDKNKRKITDGVRLAIGTAIVWGLGFALLAQAIARVGWANAALVNNCVSAIAVLFIAQLIKKDELIDLEQIRHGVGNKFVLLNTVIGMAGIIAITAAIAKSTGTGGAVATALSSTYPVITILLALHHFQEKVSPIALSGAALGIVGVIALSFS